jgi:hypothetical protein
MEERSIFDLGQVFICVVRVTSVTGNPLSMSR